MKFLGLNYWDRTLKKHVRCNKMRFYYNDFNSHYSILIYINIYLSIQGYIICLIHEFGA